MAENEPAKPLLPYLQRADELQKHEPLVSYYCRLYAMERGLRIPQSDRTKTTNALLVSLMKQLEKDKKGLKLGPEDNLYLEGFALNVFGKADKQDRAGRADVNTAKTFYAASIFFEILNQFGELQPDLEQKQKYAVWKAADIRKALKEGRKPVAGPPAGDEDLSVLSSSPSNIYDIGTTETSASGAGSESDSTHGYHNPVNYQNLPSIPPAPKFNDTLNDQNSANIPPSLQFHDRVNDNKHSSIVSPSSHSYTPGVYPSQDYHPPPSSQDYHHPPPSQEYHPPPPSQDYHPPPPSQDYPPPPSQDYHPPPPSQDYQPPPPSQDYHQPPPARSDSSYSEPYNHQQYSPDQSQNLGPNYPSHETPPPYSLPHFQSYPSFTESSLPSVPVNHTYYQGPDASYSSQSAPLTTNHSLNTQNSSSSRNGTVPEPKPTTPTYQYDSSYQPPPERIAEAHKAARFAVGALAFDDVSIAVDYLKKSLELLTNPSVGQ
ncbi:putative vacuolar protein sorting-associate protein Vta1/Callose synthase [Medicago truncatula]|uniref:Hydroxyproline-rich glycoprotein family protein n=1 Tax=Medicago truncatula TaxID=3880 RepID=G7K8Q1_MEDTR|nr:protein HOMOLOG OF MAMMALIAN LYST-INTERACTING PROTEIN 5 [Medicago truncatula]AET00604.1 hydroxyproline-rich glycoprotein family protein [Medicago truncatula]RHN57854.1 putative vacuolar protein sorting-associate protein Vta1/Callose synthase [Medicago truncatula]